ncbi:class II fructose-bisphosphate aldolase [Streptomyces sp. PSKA54]|uniref:Class II fructose-bisphosphate aldolase n=1 Tax=Streptomyces himalayensis subsp. aureolus TaxID=2758039 RepID=A0A7W2D2D8_9ACTN|nr:class II fructose-bisphosphate aldolase [Streptomyces himalayensis]MBA4863334.1 class II fructose-bisphosphate aldolase [Streptomyces himalayensis subsp. aureolus]
MTLVPTGELIAEARAAGRGLGAFNVVQLEHATAIVAGAEQARAPVVLQISENTARYHGGLEPVGLAALATARRAAVPVAVHLDHATDPRMVAEACGLGFGSVMYDASALPYEENLRATAEITARCHDDGVWVEAELGEVGGKDGVHAPGVRTDPAEAAAFTAATGVDALAVAVGTSHAMTDKTATLDFALIAGIREAVTVPLVLHGSSGVADQDLARAVHSGMTKINISTHLNAAFTRAVRDRLSTDPRTVDPRRYLAPARDAVTEEVASYLQVLKLQLQ